MREMPRMYLLYLSIPASRDSDNLISYWRETCGHVSIILFNSQSISGSDYPSRLAQLSSTGTVRSGGYAGPPPMLLSPCSSVGNVELWFLYRTSTVLEHLIICHAVGRELEIDSLITTLCGCLTATRPREHRYSTVLYSYDTSTNTGERNHSKKKNLDQSNCQFPQP